METIRETEINILVVDDEQRIRDVCRAMLSQDGYGVAVAENGYLGLQMVEKEPFDIVLLDLMMPGLSGMDLLTRVKEKHPDTVVIVITGYATLEHGVGAMKKGAFDFLPKPFGPEDLRMVIKKAVDYLRTLQDIAGEKSRMKTLINHLAVGVLATDAEKKIALANPAFLKMIGWRGRSVIGTLLDEVIENPSFRQMIDRALSMTDETFSELNQEFVNGSLAEDKDKVVGVRSVPFRDRSARILGSITVLQDITALKKMDQMKSELVSMVAHEVRSPINTVLAQIQIILDELTGPVTEKQREILTRAAEKIRGLASLSSELLDLSKIESGLINQDKEPVDMGEILKDQVAFHLSKSREKGVELNVTALPALAPVLGNRTNLEGVISNLIDNAVKYTPGGGRVEVSARAEDDRVCLCVKDSGYGIPAESLNRIFDRFYRVKDKNTRFIMGTGLGLSIVKSIVEAHNGAIAVESQPDRGSLFTVYLPAMDPRIP